MPGSVAVDAGTEAGAALSPLAIVGNTGEREVLGFDGLARFCLFRFLGLGGDMGVGDVSGVTVWIDGGGDIVCEGPGRIADTWGTGGNLV